MDLKDTSRLRTLGEIKQRKKKRAKILRGGVPLDESYEEKEITISDTPYAVVRGKIDLESPDPSGPMRFDYKAEKYSRSKVETLEELTARHQSELANLRSESEQQIKAAYEKGLQEGLSSGHQKGVEEVKLYIAKISELLEAINGATKDYFSKVEDRLANFALMISKKVVGDLAEEKREVAIRLASEAIKHATEKNKILLLCNEVDYETLNDAKADLKGVSAGIKSIEIEISQRVTPGSVILETIGGSIDATIETHLDEIHKSLLPDS